MSLAVKICGLSTAETVEAAVEGKATHVGFVFHPRSPRRVTAAQAADLARLVARPVRTCGLFVDADDATIMGTLDRVGLDLLQLHGAETPERCRQLRERTGLPVMKAIGVAGDTDVRLAERWFGAADLLLFDAKPPPVPDALPGGNGIGFDWDLLAGRDFPLPWFLSGGLGPGTVRDAIRRTRAPGIDVSSGVESSPGIKDAHRIREFLAAALSA
jgi:phosphoribosylanthranilate isomerase